MAQQLKLVAETNNMKKRFNKAFTLVESLIATVIGIISVAAIFYSYQHFNNSYQGVVDKVSVSEYGRSALNVIAKDIRNSGYRNINYTRSTWDRWIEKTDNYNNLGGDYLRIWYNTSSQDRLEVRYYLKKNTSTNDYSLVRELIENPVVQPKYVNCERWDIQKNCTPITIVPQVTDFQVILKDINGNEITPVGLSSNNAKQNQEKVHTAEIFITVRSPNEIFRNDKTFRMINLSGQAGRDFTTKDKYLRETFFLSVYLRNVGKA